MSFGAEVINRVGDEQRLSLVLSPSLPSVLIDPGDGTARVRLLSGIAVTAEIDDGELDPFSQAGPLTTVSQHEQRVFARVGREHVGLAVTWGA